MFLKYKSLRTKKIEEKTADERCQIFWQWHVNGGAVAYAAENETLAV